MDAKDSYFGWWNRRPEHSFRVDGESWVAAGIEITVYTLGWRLGGKGACGRNQAYRNRIEEHGIHLWMGFYENAFQLMRHVYDECAEKGLMPGAPFKSARTPLLP